MRYAGRLRPYSMAAGSAAFAAGYDDFSAGQNAIHRGDPDAAIAAFSHALAAGDLAPGYLPATYSGRALAYLQRGKCQDAVGDMDAALKLRSNDAEAYVLRAEAEICLKKQDAAFADFAEAVRLRPTVKIYEQFAVQQWAVGQFGGAAANFEAAIAASSKSNPHLPYLILWYAMTADRAAALDQAILAKHMRDIDEDNWPCPLLELYLGKLTADRATAMAVDRNPQTDGEHKCELGFYLAEWNLARGKGDAAKPLLENAVNNCPRTFMEYGAAVIEQRRQTK
jgi:lipoprotein NlpI